MQQRMDWENDTMGMGVGTHAFGAQEKGPRKSVVTMGAFHYFVRQWKCRRGF